jgi:hypothetical protein
MKLLPAALQKQNYALAAHVLVYGLVKASVKNPKNPPNPSTSLRRSIRGARNYHGSERKKQQEE